jgi:hypothetical protein
MQIESLDELIEVEARFGPHGMRPLAFIWQGTRRIIKEITCAWNERDGMQVHRCFAVTDGASLFELRFEPAALRWRLVRVALEG